MQGVFTFIIARLIFYSLLWLLIDFLVKKVFKLNSRKAVLYSRLLLLVLVVLDLLSSIF